MSNEYDDLVAAGVTQEKAQAARVGFVLSADTNPDAYAEAQRVARRTGVPVDTALNMPKEIGKQARIAETDFDGMAAIAPATSALLADIDKAKLAHDDIDNMTAIERGVYKLGEYTVGTSKAVASAVPKFNEGAWGATYAVTEGWARVADALFPQKLGNLVSGEDPNPVRRLANYFASLGRREKNLANELMPRSDNILGASWYSGMQSLGLNALQLPLGVGGKMAPVLTSMGVITGGQSYLEARDKGVPQTQALGFAASQGVIEAGTEMIGMPALFSILKPGQFLHKAAEYMVKEQGGEQLATALQDLNEWATLPENKDKTISDYLADRPSAAVQTALSTVFSGGGQVAVMKGVQLVMGRSEQAAKAAPFADQLSTLNKLAEASKVRERDADTALEFFQSITEDGADSVWITPQALAQSGVAQRVAEAVPSVASQIDSAITSGHDIRLPLADLLAKMPGAELDALVPHVSTEPGGFTKTTAQEYMQSGAAQELQAEVSRVLEEKRADVEFQQSVEEVRSNIKAQLDTVGRFRPQVNDAYAVLYGNFFAVQSARMGISPAEMYARYPLKVAAESVAGNQFDQSPYDHLLRMFEPDATKEKTGIAPMSEEEIKRAEDEFLSSFPQGSRYTHDTRLLERVRRASKVATDELGGNPAQPRVADRPLGAFSGYRTEGVVLPGDSFNPNGRFEVQVFGKEQVEQGLTDEPALTFTITPDGELSVNGPLPSGATFAEFKSRGWADNAVGAEGIQQVGWSALKDPNNPGKPLPISQILPLLADVHARLREWRGEDRVGMHWTRSTGALGGLFGNDATAVFFQKVSRDGTPQTETPEFKKWFGDSKVVDDEGKPLVVYHGSPDLRFMEDGATFKSQKDRLGFGAPDGAHWFASSKEAAKTYADPRRAFDYQNAKEGVIPAYLSLLNPLIVDAQGQNWRDAQRRGKTSNVIAEARSRGHDGVIIRNVKDNYNNDAKTRSTDTYVVFDSKQIKSAIGNRGTFDPNDPNILHQNSLGKFNPETNVITLLKGANLSTFLHESGHFFLEVMADMAARQDAPAEVQQDMQALLQWFGVRDLAEWHALPFEEKRAYHEQFARGFEAYLFEGKAPAVEIQGLFQRFRAWMLQVYKQLKALNVELTDEVRGVMDRMLASSEQIRIAEQARNMLPIFETAEQAGMSVEEFSAYHALGNDASNEAVQELQAKGLRDMRLIHNAHGRMVKKLQKEAKALRAEVQMDARREVMSQPIYRAWQFLTGKMAAEDRFKNDNYRNSDPSAVDPGVDSMFVAIAKMGGIDNEQLIKEWGLDPIEKVRADSGFGGKSVVNRKGGVAIDEMGMRLAEKGYLDADENGRYDQREFEEKFFDGLGGHDHYSLAFDYDNAVEKKPGEQLKNPEALGAGRFDRQAVLDMNLPEHVFDRLSKSKMLAKAGMHPDIVAEMFGFTSGDELARELAVVEAPRHAIEGLTDQMMLERHGELSSQEAIERAADAAIHNEVRSRLVATELAMLEKAVGPKRTLAKAAKDYAYQMVSRLLLRDIRPSQYANGEARSAKASSDALKKGDVDLASTEKRNQLIQGYAAKAAYNAQDEIDAGLRYLKKFDGKSKNLDAEYAEQIASLLERFDLRKISNKEVERRKSLAEWVASQREIGVEPDIPQDLLNEAMRIPYKRMTLEAFRGLVDTVKQIEHLGRLKHKLLTAADQRSYEEARDLIVVSINEHANGREANTRTPTTNLGRAAQVFRKFWTAHIKVATWARVMDGGKDGGPMWDYFIRGANERGDMETRMRAEATAKLSEILAPVFKQGKMGGAGKFFPSIKRSLNRESCIAIALNVGNEGNLQRLLGGEGWTVQQIMPVLESLTEVERQAVQSIWDHFENYRPLISAKEMRVYGKEPDWVKAGTFITDRLGLRGGYYPIKCDPSASQRAEEHSDAEAAKRQLQGAYTSATTRRSFTKARVEEVNGRPLLYTLSGVYSGFNEVIHDLAWHEWLIDTNRLMRSQSIDAAIREHYGPEVKQQIKSWSNDIAEGEKGVDAAVDMALSRLRQGVSAAGLGFNVVSAFMQPLGITQSMVRVGTAWSAKGVAKYLAGIRPLGKNALTAEVNSKSSFMAERARTRFRELNELRNQVQDQSKFRELTGRYAYWLMMRFQQMVDVPTWQGAYEKALASGNDEVRAVALADQAVIDSQGSGMTKDLAGIERGGPAQKLFTVFYSFMNTAMNIGVGQTMTANTPAKRAKLAADYLLLYVIPPILGLALKNAITPGDSGDDEDLGKLAKRLAAVELDYLMGLMVVVREFAETGKTLVGANDLGRDYTGPAGLRVITDAGKAAKQTAQGEFDDAFRKAFVNVLGSVFGLPSAQVNRTVSGVEAIKEGKTENPAAVVFGFQTKH